jgi:hypothetical protein
VVFLIVSESGGSPNQSAPEGSKRGEERPSRLARLGALPVHPLLVALFPVLSLYSYNIGEILPSDLGRPIAFSLIATCSLWALLAAVLRDARKSAVVATAGATFFFGYGHLANALPETARPLLLPLGLLAIGLLAWFMRGRRRAPHGLTTALNLMAIVLVVPSLYMLLVAAAGQGVQSAALQPRTRTERPIIPPAAPDLPDIYLIVLDAYGREDILRSHYGFDNTPFLKALEQRGFTITPRSHSNYGQTVLSLASTLNMTYLDEAVSGVGRDSADREVIRRMLDENAVAEFLRPLGYQFVYVGSGSGEVRITRADVKLQEKAPRTPAEAQILGLTPLAASRAMQQYEYDTRRQFIQTAFTFLESLPERSYPKFVLAHIAAPHPPFLFGPNGEPRTPRGIQSGEDGSSLLTMITPEEYKKGYIEQLQYVNRRVLASLDLLIKKSRVPPIIILQGDHGPRLTLDWFSMERTDLSEPFSILNAYLVPDQVRKRLWDSITPVNTFRLLLSHRFGANFKPLPDRVFYSTMRRPLDFVDVTKWLPEPLSPSDGRPRSAPSLPPRAASQTEAR